MNKILLDANVLIRALNHDRNTTEPEYLDAVRTLEDSLNSESSVVVMTPLIMHEVMRGISRSDRSKVERIRDILENFQTIEITNEISEVATTIYQNLKEQSGGDGVQPTNLRKHGFDIMHAATAHVYDLEIISNDSDIAKFLRLI